MSDAWIQTHTGVRFDLLDTTVDMIRLEDIAIALSRQTRFNGHLRRFYSVAEHSVHVASLLPYEIQMYGLLHDAAEAYIGDMVKPLKNLFPEFSAIDDRISALILERFDLAPPDETTKKLVKLADLDMLVTEKEALMAHHRRHDWKIYETGAKVRPIQFWDLGWETTIVATRFQDAVMSRWVMP